LFQKELGGDRHRLLSPYILQLVSYTLALDRLNQTPLDLVDVVGNATVFALQLSHRQKHKILFRDKNGLDKLKGWIAEGQVGSQQDGKQLTPVPILHDLDYHAGEVNGKLFPYEHPLKLEQLFVEVVYFGGGGEEASQIRQGLAPSPSRTSSTWLPPPESVRGAAHIPNGTPPDLLRWGKEY